MGKLFDRIRAAASAERVMLSAHADEQIRERMVAVWQVIAGVRDGRQLVERPKDKPNPVVEVEQSLADGTPVKVVWAYVKSDDVALVVTVHFFDR